MICCIILCLYSSGGWGQECCYSRTGDLILRNKDRGTVIRMSADWQPLQYMRQEYWPKFLCTQLAKYGTGYRKIRPSDDCSNYVEPSKHGTCSIMFRRNFTVCIPNCIKKRYYYDLNYLQRKV